MRDFKSKALAHDYMPRCAEFLVHGFFDKFGCRLKITVDTFIAEGIKNISIISLKLFSLI